jgi:hypothetical protein
VEEKREPHYPLADVKAAVRADRYIIPGRVDEHMRSRGWRRAYAHECLLGLEVFDFHKSQAHRARPGVWLDVYRPRHCGERLYVKLTIHEDERRFILLSFCGDGEEH